MNNLLVSVFCALALVACSKAKQLSTGPQAFEESSSLSMPQKLDKRYATRVITLYLTPGEMKALNDAEDTANKEIQQSYFQKDNEQQQLKTYNQFNKNPAPVDEPQAELRGLLAHNSFYPKEEKSTFENQQWNYDFTNLYSEEKPKEEQKEIIYSDFIKNEPQEKERKTQQESEFEKQSEWNTFNPESAIKEKTLLYEQLKQQWDNIFGQNRVQLKAISTMPKKNQNIKESNTEDNAAEKTQSDSENEEKTEIEKQIEAILRQQQAFEDERQSALAQREAENQKLPIIIHKEVSVTKHLPVPVIKKVKVPTPVLVPVPEPYEVKIPHPYPVPFKIVKHIPVPIVKNY